MRRSTLFLTGLLLVFGGLLWAWQMTRRGGFGDSAGQPSGNQSSLADHGDGSSSAGAQTATALPSSGSGAATQPADIGPRPPAYVPTPNLSPEDGKTVIASYNYVLREYGFPMLLDEESLEPLSKIPKLRYDMSLGDARDSPLLLQFNADGELLAMTNRAMSAFRMNPGVNPGSRNMQWTWCARHRRRLTRQVP